jgi:hypothetical protein
MVVTIGLWVTLASSSPVGARYDEDRPVGMVQGGHGHAAEHDLLHGGSASGSDDQ